MSWADVCDFVYRYQTLIAGVIAILAAILAAWPVWHQLGSMRVQTNTILRDYVLEQLRRNANRRKWYSERLGKFNEDIRRRIYEMEELEGGTINVHWAHSTQSRAQYLLKELKDHGETRDLSAVESELADVLSSLSKLIDTLDAIHRPASLVQHDEDHSFTDEQWAELRVVGEKAEEDLSGVANTLSEETDRLEAAFAKELGTFRLQLKQVQDSLKSA